MHYVVTWQIDIEDADTPEEAAREALRIQRKVDSIATVFDVAPYGKPSESVRVDLEEITEEAHYMGLAAWVADYQVMRKAGNMAAVKLRDRIKAVIDQHGLDGDRVWNTDPDAPVNGGQG